MNVSGIKNIFIQFVDNVDVMMDAADYNNKAGRTLLSESHLQKDCNSNNESASRTRTRNLNFLVNNGAAIIVNDALRFQAINQMFALSMACCNDGGSVRHLSKPNAT